MAHYAEINNEGEVLRVLVVDDMFESNGQEYLSQTLGLGGTWVKTSYNTLGGVHLNGGIAIHKNYAGVGDIFDGHGFHKPQPYPSWTLNKDTYFWEPPVAKPEDGKLYSWNEEILNWELINN